MPQQRATDGPEPGDPVRRPAGPRAYGTDTMKVRILSYLETVTDASAGEVADALGASRPAAGMSLLRLNRSGLVERTFDPDRGCHYYALTARGIARLSFLQRRA